MPGILCEHCTGACCKYVALPIETPETLKEFDDVRWYLLHEGISVFIEDGDWYITMTTHCRHLQPDNRCGIYETRPQICRDYTTDNCDYHSGDYNWTAHFTCPEHLDDYVELVFKREKAEKKEQRRAAKSDSGTTRGKRMRSRLKADLSRRRASELASARRQREARYAEATSDLRGVPLPVLSIR